MDGIIQKLAEIGPLTIILVIAMVVTLIPLMVKTWKDLLNSLGLITKQSVEDDEKERDFQELRDKVDNYQKEIEEKQEVYHEQSIKIRTDLINSQEKLDKNQQNLKSDIKELRTMFVDKEINDIRWEILTFSNSVSAGRKYNQEAYNHILELYDIYEAILEKEGRTNGRVDSSIAFVKERYSELMTNGFK